MTARFDQRLRKLEQSPIPDLTQGTRRIQELVTGLPELVAHPAITEAGRTKLRELIRLCAADLERWRNDPAGNARLQKIASDRVRELHQTLIGEREYLNVLRGRIREDARGDSSASLRPGEDE